MLSRALILCTLVLLASDTMESSDSQRKPVCAGMAEILACPMNLVPVCGSDGNTYANECLMCVERQKTKSEIVIMKDGEC